MRNPYRKEKGFALRFQKACKALENHAIGLPSIVKTRAFDACFEMKDGNAMVFEIIHLAKSEDKRTLLHGIEAAGFMQDWSEFYEKTLKERDSLLSHC